jgi:hypothetical protein
VENVEDLQHRRTAVAGRPGEAIAKPGEVRLSVAAQTDELAVERRPTLAENTRDRTQLGEIV